jgi:putative Ca2+/H+ antiporter (TMEM165/GDT1 family)
MDAFLTSAALVALAEMGDKTQLLAILLVTRLRKPWPIIAGIFCATIVNHFLAALLGHWIAGILLAPWFRIAVALGFIAMAAWTLVPDKMDDDEPVRAPGNAGVFMTTLISFFIVEMGDKTQIATVALGAHFANVYAVTMGTTVGMMVANVPAVLLGDALVKRIPVALMRYAAAALFLVIGGWMLAQQLGWTG